MSKVYSAGVEESNENRLNCHVKAVTNETIHPILSEPEWPERQLQVSHFITGSNF